MKNAYKPSRRDFGKGIFALIAGAAIPGCGSGSSSGGSAPAPTLASNFTVDYSKNLVDGLAVGPNGHPPLQTNLVHNINAAVRPTTDLSDIAFGLRMTSPSGKVDWQLYSPMIDLDGGTEYVMPINQFPVKNGPNGQYTLDWLVKSPTVEDVVIRMQPQVIWDGKQVASTFFVSEAIDYLNRLYKDTPNPGMVYIVGDTAPASDTVSGIEIANKFVADAQASYGHAAPILEGKPVSEMPVLTGKNGFPVGRGANNARVNDLMTALGSAIPADSGYLETGELADGSVYIMVSGTDDFRVRQAARALATHNTPAYNFNGKKVKVTGTTLTDLTVAPL